LVGDSLSLDAAAIELGVASLVLYMHTW
jgi:hypothetical protein